MDIYNIESVKCLLCSSESGTTQIRRPPFPRIRLHGSFQHISFPPPSPEQMNRTVSPTFSLLAQSRFAKLAPDSPKSAATAPEPDPFPRVRAASKPLEMEPGQRARCVGRG